MRKRQSRFSLIIMALLANVTSHAADVEGSRDHPMSSRYTDSEIIDSYVT